IALRLPTSQTVTKATCVDGRLRTFANDQQMRVLFQNGVTDSCVHLPEVVRSTLAPGQRRTRITQRFIVKVVTNYSFVVLVSPHQCQRVALKLLSRDRACVSAAVRSIGAGSLIEPQTIRLLASIAVRPAIVCMVIEDYAQADLSCILHNFV